MKCKNCGAEVGIEYRLCPYCHSEIDYPDDDQPVIIQHIYNTPPPNQQYPNQQYLNQQYPNQQYPNNQYPNYNTPYQNQPYNPYVSSKSKVMAITMCIVFGGFGIHRFYVGKVGTGILYMFTLGLFGIGWIHDVVKICTNTFTDCFGLPVTRN